MRVPDTYCQEPVKGRANSQCTMSRVSMAARVRLTAGGHMTNTIITFTDRFKAASSGAGAANWISRYAQSDKRAGRPRPPAIVDARGRFTYKERRAKAHPVTF